MKKSNAKVRLITHLIVAIVLTIFLVWVIGKLGSGTSGDGSFKFPVFSCGINLGGYTYKDADKYSVGEFSLDEEITSLDIDWIAGQVNLVVTDESKISASETNVEDEAERLRYRVVDGKLMIKFKKSERVRINDELSKELTVYIPKEMAEKLDSVNIQCVSAGLDIEGATIDKLEIEMVSGEFDARDIIINSVNLESVSGDVEIAGSVNELDAELVSGEIKVTSDEQLSMLDMETVSGDITVIMPEGDGFTAEMDSVSGDMNIDFETTKKGDKLIFKDGSADYSFDTVSGDVDLKKAE